MEGTTPTTPPSTPPSTPPTPQVAPQVAPQMAEGGSTSSGGIKDVFKNLNWVEVGFGILGATALFYAIYYFRYNINDHKNFVKNIESKVDDLTIKLYDVSGAVTQQKEQPLDVFI